MPPAFRPGFNINAEPVSPAKERAKLIGAPAAAIPQADIPILQGGEPPIEMIMGLNQRIKSGEINPNRPIGDPFRIAQTPNLVPGITDFVAKNVPPPEVIIKGVTDAFKNINPPPPVNTAVGGTAIDNRATRLFGELGDEALLISGSLATLCASLSGKVPKNLPQAIAKLCAIGSINLRNMLGAPGKTAKDPKTAAARAEAKWNKAANDAKLPKRVTAREAAVRAAKTGGIKLIDKSAFPKKKQQPKKPDPGVGLREILLIILGLGAFKVGAGFVKSRLSPKAGAVPALSPVPAPSTAPSIVPTFDPVRESLRQQRRLLSLAIQGAPSLSLGQIAGAGLSTNLSTLTFPQAQTAAARRCVERGQRRRDRGKCEEGFYKESRRRTRFIPWREYDCRTGKTIRELK